MKSAEYYINGGFIINFKDRGETKWKIKVLKITQ